MRASRAACCMMALAGAAASALADGGVPIASATGIDGPRTLLMRPAEPSAGPVEFTLLGARTQGLMLSVQGPADSMPVVIPWGRGPVDSALAAESAFDAPGAWVVRVTAADGTVPLQATVQVAPAAPGAWSRWPWLLAWVPLVGLLALRDIATTYTAHRTRA